MSIVSDVLAQKLSNSGGAIDCRSILNQSLVGLFVRGPMVHYWYVVLEHLFKSWNPDDFSTAVAKVFVDQTVFSPLFNLLYFYVIGFLQGDSQAKINAAVSKDFAKVMGMNYKVWPLVNLVNFALVPAKLRVLFGNIVAIFWVAFVILRTQEKKPKVVPADDSKKTE